MRILVDLLAVFLACRLLTYSEYCGQLHKMRKGLSTNFPHDLAAMDADCDFAYPQLVSGLLIQESIDNERQNLALA